MTPEQLGRINELARKSKAEGLTPEEKLEQARLRGEYIASIRSSVEAQLGSTEIIEPDGTRHKLTRSESPRVLH